MPTDRMCNGFRALWMVGKATPPRLVGLADRDVDELLDLQEWAGHQSFVTVFGDSAVDEVYRLIAESVALALDEKRPSLRGGLTARLHVAVSPRPPQWVMTYEPRPLPTVKAEIEWTSSAVDVLRIKVDRVVLKDGATRAVMYGHVVEPTSKSATYQALARHGFTRRWPDQT